MPKGTKRKTGKKRATPQPGRQALKERTRLVATKTARLNQGDAAMAANGASSKQKSPHNEDFKSSATTIYYILSGSVLIVLGILAAFGTIKPALSVSDSTDRLAGFVIALFGCALIYAGHHQGKGK